MKLRLIEGSVEGDYNKFYSSIDRDTFNNIVKLDPKTAVKGDEITNIGFGAKQLLLPKWLSGDHSLLEKSDDIKQAFETFYANMKSYPAEFKNLASYKSVDDFIKYTKGESVEAQEITKENPIDVIYKKYYSNIERKEFDELIALDSETTDSKLGDVAKNLILPKVMGGEKIEGKDELKNSIDNYYADFSVMSKEDQDLNSYSSIKDFIQKMLSGADSDLVTRLKNDETIDPRTHRPVKDDAIVIGSTRNYDIILMESHRAAVAVSGGYRNNDGMHWCTGWEPDGSYENDNYFNNYGTGDKRIVAFIKKGADRGSANRPSNWQIAIRVDTGFITEFLDGNDRSPNFKGSNVNAQFKNFLIAYPDIARTIFNKYPFQHCLTVSEAINASEMMSKPVAINNTEDILLLKNNIASGIAIKEVNLNIEDVPPLLLAGVSSLTAVTFSDKVKNIGAGAFRNCLSIKSIKLPDGLETIGKSAFEGCSGLTGTIRIPDSVIQIKTNAFADTHIRLSINKERTAKLQISKADEEWFKTHAKGILIRY